MTEKDLKKLSRLEILEILLEESKENERLRDEVKKIKEENSTQNSENKLLQLTKQMNDALLNVNKLVCDLQGSSNSKGDSTVRPVETKPATTVKVVGQNYPTPPKKGKVPIDEKTWKMVVSDIELYWRIMQFYLKNEELLDSLPSDIQEDIRTRLRGISNARK